LAVAAASKARVHRQLALVVSELPESQQPEEAGEERTEARCAAMNARYLQHRDRTRWLLRLRRPNQRLRPWSFRRAAMEWESFRLLHRRASHQVVEAEQGEAVNQWLELPCSSATFRHRVVVEAEQGAVVNLAVPTHSRQRLAGAAAESLRSSAAAAPADSSRAMATEAVAEGDLRAAAAQRPSCSEEVEAPELPTLATSFGALQKTAVEPARVGLARDHWGAISSRQAHQKHPDQNWPCRSSM
jgi:hypothetical protein